MHLNRAGKILCILCFFCASAHSAGDIDTIIDTLVNGSPRESSRIAQRVRDDPQIIYDLAQAMDDSNPERAGAAVKALKIVGDARAVPAFARYLETKGNFGYVWVARQKYNPWEEVQSGLATGFGEAGVECLYLLARADGRCRNMAVRLLGQSGNEKYIIALVSKSRKTDGAVGDMFKTVSRTVSKAGLREALKSPNEVVQLEAAQCLEGGEGAAALFALASSTSSRYNTYGDAARLLGRSGNEAYIVAFIKKCPDGRAQEAFEQARDKLSTQSLGEALETGDERVRFAIAQEIKKRNDVRALPALIKAREQLPGNSRYFIDGAIDALLFAGYPKGPRFSHPSSYSAETSAAEALTRAYKSTVMSIVKNETITPETTAYVDAMSGIYMPLLKQTADTMPDEVKQIVFSAYRDIENLVLDTYQTASVRALAETDTGLRLYALRSLGVIGDPSVLKTLEKTVKDSPEEKIKNAARDSIDAVRRSEKAPVLGQGLYRAAGKYDLDKVPVSASAASNLSWYDLVMLKNEIYARKGYVFKKPELLIFFKRFRWYRPDPGVTEEKMNAVEKKNASYLSRRAEQKKSAGDAEYLLQNAQRLYASKNYEEALLICRLILNNFRDSSNNDRVLFLLARISNEMAGEGQIVLPSLYQKIGIHEGISENGYVMEYDNAACSEIVKRYPGSPLVEDSKYLLLISSYNTTAKLRTLYEVNAPVSAGKRKQALAGARKAVKELESFLNTYPGTKNRDAILRKIKEWKEIITPPRYDKGEEAGRQAVPRPVEEPQVQKAEPPVDPEKQVAQLVAQLSSENLGERQRAREALIPMGHRAAGPAAQVLLNGKTSARVEAVYVLQGLHDESTIGPLIKALSDDSDYRIAYVASEVLVQIGSPAVTPLLEAMKNDILKVKMRELATLGKIQDERVTEVLLSALDDPNMGVTAIWALGERREKKAVGPLLKLLEHFDRSATPHVFVALGKIQDRSTMGPIREIAFDRSIEAVYREHAFSALAGLTHVFKDKELFGPLCNALKEDNSFIRQEAVYALGNLGEKRAIPVLEAQFKKEEDSSVLTAIDGVLADLKKTPGPSK